MANSFIPIFPESESDGHNSPKLAPINDRNMYDVTAYLGRKSQVNESEMMLVFTDQNNSFAMCFLTLQSSRGYTWYLFIILYMMLCKNYYYFYFLT